MKKQLYSIVLLPRSLKILILNSFLMAMGSFMVTPFLAIFLRQSLKIDIKVIGLLIAFSTLVQFGGGLIGAFIAEYLGLKKTMVISLGFRVLGFLLLIVSIHMIYFILPAIFLVAAGAAVYLPANRAYLISNVQSEHKSFFVSVSNSSLNAGMALGPLVAGLLIENNPTFIFTLVAIIFSFLATIHQLTLVKDLKLPIDSRLDWKQIPGTIQQLWPFLIVNVVTYYFYFYFQNFLGLSVSEIGLTSIFSYCLLLNFGLMFLIQPLISLKIKKISPKNILAFGFTSVGVGFWILSFREKILFFIGTVFFTIGQACLILFSDISVVQSLPRNPAVAFGLQRLATGIGGLFCGILGGVFYSYFKNNFWIIISIQAFFIGVLFIFKKVQHDAS